MQSYNFNVFPNPIPWSHAQVNLLGETLVDDSCPWLVFQFLPDWLYPVVQRFAALNHSLRNILHCIMSSMYNKHDQRCNAYRSFSAVIYIRNNSKHSNLWEIELTAHLSYYEQFGKTFSEIRLVFFFSKVSRSTVEKKHT